MSKPVETGQDAPILLTMGEPAGIGPEIAVLAWHRLGGRTGARPLRIVGDPALFPGIPGVIATKAKTSRHPGEPDPRNSAATIEAIEIAVTEALAGIAENREVIDQAKGMLMLVYQVEADKAFDLLKWRSQSTNVKLRALAQQLAATGRRHGGGGHRAEREQDSPGHVVADARAEQGQRDQRPDDQPERLRAEHHPDQLAAVLPVRVLAHHDRADRVVAADADAEHEAEPDQHPERAGQRRAQRPGDHDGGDQPVHPLTADHVRVAAEYQGAEERGGQHRAVQQGQLARAQVPVLGDQRRGDPDDEQVVGVGEKAHPGDQQCALAQSPHGRLVSWSGQA